MNLSIIIPVYRTQNTLQRCLESILCQSFTDYEIILVDDGSPDNCPYLCDEYAVVTLLAVQALALLHDDENATDSYGED